MYHGKLSLVAERQLAYVVWAMKLYYLRYSPYARKVQILLDLLGERHEDIEMNYSDRTELAELTGGYVYVPVLAAADGTVTVESRDICQRLLQGAAAERFTPSPLEGPIWAYADFVDGPLEDVLFRIASPVVRELWKSAGDRALYVLIKERKFGAGCLDQWARDRAVLTERGRKLLAPTLRTLALQPFLFGQQPTLADAALYGVCAMLFEADPELLSALSPALRPFMLRVEAAATAAKAA
ncbi:MAG TPA: glutathione S-transferase family protein [Polyangiales bacterium]|nr:glutathione S-transferase family protein [Polyangiales bacterium]